MKNTFILFFLLLASHAVFAVASDDYANHPQPQDPLYIEASWYDSLKTKVPPPPAMNSAEQKQDEQIVLEKQKNRTKKDCDRASTEVFVGIGPFFGKPYGFLSEDQIKVLSTFIDQVRSDSSYFISKLKNDTHRARPFQTLPQISPCIAKDPSQSYPSGHATISEVFALVLEDLYPAKKTEIEARALQIAQDRVLAGIHYPSDVNEGRKLAKLIYTEMKKSVRFQTELTMLKKKLQE